MHCCVICSTELGSEETPTRHATEPAQKGIYTPQSVRPLGFEVGVNNHHSNSTWLQDSPFRQRSRRNEPSPMPAVVEDRKHKGTC